jgi:hypothetical protein
MADRIWRHLPATGHLVLFLSLVIRLAILTPVNIASRMTMVQFGVKLSDRVGVIGIGGLGHLALQF